MRLIGPMGRIGKYSRRMLAAFTVLVLLLSYQAGPWALVYAQEPTLTSSPSPQPTDTTDPIPSSVQATPTAPSPITPSPTPPPSPTPTPQSDTTPTPTILPTLTPALPDDNPTPLSARIKRSSRLHKLQKKFFHANEKITLTLEKDQETDISSVLLTDSEKNIYPVLYEQQKIADLTSLLIQPPPSLRPGKYTVTVIDTNGQELQEDFSLGVLAINTNKSIYTPGQEAHLAMAVLNPQGTTVCDAAVTLEIFDPASQKTLLSTENGGVHTNPECRDKYFTLAPDYWADYKTGLVGSYTMVLTATTKDGTTSITDYFEVHEKVPFDVERTTATRIFPPMPYPVTITVRANQDFTGTITETVPDEFRILPSLTDSSYDAISTPEAEIKPPTQTAFAPARLPLPFTGRFPTTLGFGEEPEDPFVKKKYLQFGLAAHDGVDFAMPRGTPVLAVDAGSVVLAGEGAYGNTVVIEHDWGKSYYGHLDRTLIQQDQTVQKGTPIGLSGNTGLSTNPHLHFGIKLKEHALRDGYFGKIDPGPLLGLEQTDSRVLPDSQAPHAKLKKLHWRVSLKAGDKITLGYRYDAPDIAPKIYKLGPLQFFEEGAPGGADGNHQENPFVLGASQSQKLVFEEARAWQIAADAINWEEKDNGFVESSTITSVTTSTNSTAVNNHLYLAAVSTKPNKSIDTVTGLGLSWTLVASQCADRNQTNTAVFWALGTPTGDGTVTANLNGGSQYSGGAVISVHRYSGTDTSSPIGNIETANTGGVGASAGVCDGTGTDSNSYSFSTLDTSQADSLVFSAVSLRQRTHTAGTNYDEKDEINSGTGGNTAGVAVQDQFFKVATTNLTVDGTLSSTVDWAVVAFEVKIAGAAGPTNAQLLRHGGWFNGSGVEQPFTF